MEKEKIVSALSEYFSMQGQVAFAYLFGSCAKDASTPLSDVDVAVMSDESLSADERFALRLQLMGDMCALLKTDRIDLILLNEAPLLLSFRVVRDGIIVSDRDEKKRIHFEVKTMSFYFDFQYYYQRHAKLTINRIAQEGIL